MADKLQLWNRALFHIGEGQIFNTDPAVEESEAAYVFDEMWPTVVLDALSRGDFNFAAKTAEIDQSTTTTPVTGYDYAYAHPDDWIRTIAFSYDGDFTDASLYDIDSFDVYDEAKAWHTNYDALYVRYISDDYAEDDQIPNYPPSFFEVCALLLAFQSCERLTQGTQRQLELEKKFDKQLRKAKSNDARNMPKTRIRTGNWLKSWRGNANRRSGAGTLVGGQIQTTEGNTSTD